MANNETHNLRLDLALEAKEWREQFGAVQGVRSTTIDKEGVRITTVDILDERGAQTLGKPPGQYITFEAPRLRQHEPNFQDVVADLLAAQIATTLRSEFNLNESSTVLIVGLGNWNVTPDALGPLVVDNVTVTRHLYEFMPEHMERGYRNVSAIAPGVLGSTGIESSDIVQSIVERSKPDVVIAVDALASRSVERVNTTIQLATTGIHPGSGIGNKRRGLTRETLGVPVLAIGVPTVVYASTIVHNVLSRLGMLAKMGEHQQIELIRNSLGADGQDLLVTPKEVDQFVEDIANVIAMALNSGLHEAIQSSNVAVHTH